MKVTKSVLVLTVIIVAGFGGLVFIGEVTAGGTGTCVTPDGRNVPCSPPPSGGRSSDGGRSRPAPSKPSEYTTTQPKARQPKATKLKNLGDDAFERGDYKTAIRYYKEALEYDSTDEVIRKNLGAAQNELGLSYYNRHEYKTALYWFEHAVKNYPDSQTIQNNLSFAKFRLLSQKREAERQRESDKAKKKVAGMLDDLAAEFNISSSQGSSSTAFDSSTTTSDSLEFVGSGEPLYSKGSKTSAPVDLTFMEPDKPMVVDPRVVKGEMTPAEARKDRENEIKVKAEMTLAVALVGQGNYDDAISYLRKAEKIRPDDSDIKKAIVYTKHLRDSKNMPPNPKVEALLDALEYGQCDWQKSVEYLKDAYKKDSNNLPVRDALQFTEGISGYWLPPGEIPLPPGYKAPLLKDEVHELTNKGVQSIGDCEYEKAYDYFRKAHEQSPEDLGIRDMVNFSEGLWAAQQSIE